MSGFQPFGPGTRVFKDAEAFFDAYNQHLSVPPFRTVAKRFAAYCQTDEKSVISYMEQVRTRLNRVLKAQKMRRMGSHRLKGEKPTRTKRPRPNH